VQLCELEGVAEPLFTLGGRQWCGDLLTPPQARLARVAVRKTDETIPRDVERAEGVEAAVRRMPSERVGEAVDSPVPQRKPEGSAENPQRLLEQAPAELLGSHSPHEEPRPVAHKSKVAQRAQGWPPLGALRTLCGLRDLLSDRRRFRGGGRQAVELQSVIDHIDFDSIALAEIAAQHAPSQCVFDLALNQPP